MVTRGKGEWGEWTEVKGVKCMVTEDLTLGGEHRMQYIDDVLYICTLETCIILLPDVTPINLIKNN